ncbi:MAG: Hpt domain-containing protein [bacterium]|nr:Hpt domain-containing protein [bacterium]
MAKDTLNLDGVMNLAEAMGNMDGDAELLQEIVTIFMQTGPTQLDTLANALAAGAIKDVAIQAHGMKGGASNFCARRFVASALKLELLAKSGTLVGGEALLAAMRENYAELEELVPLINWDEVAQNWSR